MLSSEPSANCDPSAGGGPHLDGVLTGWGWALLKGGVAKAVFKSKPTKLVVLVDSSFQEQFLKDH